jgi:hypothetical protein
MKDRFINAGVSTLVLLPIVCMSGLALNYFAVLPDGISQLWFLIPMVMEAVFIVFAFILIGILTGDE